MCRESNPNFIFKLFFSKISKSMSEIVGSSDGVLAHGCMEEEPQPFINNNLNLGNVNQEVEDLDPEMPPLEDADDINAPLFIPGGAESDSSSDWGDEIAPGMRNLSLYEEDTEPEEGAASRDFVPLKPVNVSTYDWYRGRFAENVGAICSGASPLVSGRSFSLSQLNEISDEVLADYRKISANCAPIPAGFWEEVSRLDQTCTAHMAEMQASLPNEDWVCRRVTEGCLPSVIIER